MLDSRGPGDRHPHRAGAVPVGQPRPRARDRHLRGAAAQSATNHNPFDYFHVNSVQLDADGNLLISGRNTWAAYKVSHQNGAVMWTLGGKHSSFRMGPATSFAFQHDVRVEAASDQYVTVFDDGAGPPTVHSQSRALKLRLDLQARTATMWSTSTTTRRRCSRSSRATYQQLPDADDFVGWGQEPYFTEYDSRGRAVLDGPLRRRHLELPRLQVRLAGAPPDRRRRWRPRRPAGRPPCT